MIMPNYVAILLLICSTWSVDTEAGHVNQKGSSFDILFGPNLFRSGAGINPQLLVTTSEPNPVTFWVAWNKVPPPTRSVSNTTHTVSRGEVVAITVPLVVAINAQSPHISDLRIQLQTQGGKEVTVVAVNEQQASTDAFLAFPKIETKSKSYEYYTLSVSRGPPDVDTRSFFGIARIEPETTCSISPIADLTTARFIPIPGTSNTITLSRRISSDTNFNLTLSNTVTSVAAVSQRNGDLSGTRVVCDKPVSFITGHQCGRLPSDKTACDHMVEQVPPTETWGFQFFLVALSTRTEDGYRILASRAGTQCNITCTVLSLSQIIILADPGNFKEFILQNGYCSVECNRPVLIFQYSLGHENDGVTRSDPFIVMIPPVGQYSNDYDLIFFESKSLDTRGVAVAFEAWINIAVPVEYDPSGLRFDGDPLSGVSFRDVTCSNGEVCGRVAQYKPTSRTGAHTLAHTDPNAKFIATVYGWERENTYGYIGGMNFDSIAAEVFCIANPSPSASESDGKASFVVTRTGSATDRSCILYNVTDISTQGLADYMSPSGDCCLEPNEKRKTCEVQLVTDSVGEEDEVLRIELNPKPGQCVCDPPNTRTDITIQDKQVEPCVFSLEKDRYHVNETDGTVRIGVVKTSGSIPSGESVMVTVTPREGAGQVEGADPATSDVDYSSAAQQVVFQPNDTIQYVDINITTDGVFECPEYFHVDMMVPEGSAASVGEPDSATIFIWEEGNTIAFENATYSTSESVGFYEEVRFVASQPFSKDTDVNISYMDISATGGPDVRASGIDYGNEVYTVTFKAGSRFSTYASIPIAPDDSCEQDEKFKATFDLPGGCRHLVKGDPEEAEITIEDVKDIVAEFDTIHYNVSESDGFVKLSLVSNCATNTEYSVVVSPEDGSAIAGEDYLIGVAPYTATFAPGETTATVVIPIRDDSVLEPPESFDALLSIPGPAASLGVQAGGRDRSTVWIDDDDKLEVVFDPTSYRVNEDGVTACLTLKANGTASFDYSVTVETVDGTAAGGEDYEGGVVEVLFTAGSSEAKLKINITDDAVPELNETFTVRLSDPWLIICVGSDDTANISIIDDDEEITVEFEKIVYNVSESDGFALLTLKSSSPSSTEYSVEITTQDGSARAGDDYIVVVAPFTAIFAPGETTATVLIPIRDDSVLEPRESFDALLSIPEQSASLGVRAGSRDRSTVWIDDDDILEVVFDPVDYEVSEGNGSVLLRLKANGSASFDYTVQVNTSDGSANAGSDYTGGTYTATFLAGQTTATVEVPILDDDELEPDETFNGSIAIPRTFSSRGVNPGPQDSATVTIEDNDGVVVELDPTSYDVNESDGSVTITLRSSSPAAFPYTVVVITSDGTAKDGEDYTGGRYEVTFPAGSTTASVTVSITNNDSTECTEEFTAELRVPPQTRNQGISRGSANMALVTIFDDDATQISFEPVEYTVSETDGKVNITLRSSKMFSFDCKLTVSTRDGTAKEAVHYQSLDASMVTMAAGSDSVVVMVDILDDDSFACHSLKDFFVDLNISEECSACGVSEGGDNTATVNIEDTDVVTVQFDPTTYREVEGDTTVDLVLTADMEIECTFDVRVDTEDGNATVADSDYMGTPSGGVVATFTPGSMSVTVPVSIRDDLVKEGDEYFVARVSQPDDPQDGVQIGPSDTANVIIEDNEGVIRVKFVPDAYTVDERDGMVTIKLESDTPIQQDYIVNVQTSDRSATSPEDYAGDTYEAFFEAGKTTATISVPINDDKVCGEMDEEFVAELSIPDASAVFGVVPGAPTMATVTIEDDDEVEVQFNPAVHTVDESDGMVDIPIECGSCADSYTVSITCSDGTAESDSDYVASGTMEAVCEPGSNTSISVPIMNDATAEQTETFSCQIVDVPDGVTPGPNDIVTVRIVDDDSIVVNFNPVEYSTKEEDGMVTLTVVASAPSSEQYSIFVDTSDGVDPDSSATSSEDYIPGPYEVVFPPGVTEVTVTVGISRDDDCECDEEFTAQLRSPTSGDVSIGVNDTASITIVDDDVCRIMFSPDEDKKVVENVGTTEVCLEVEKNCIGDFQICMNTADGADRDRRAEAGEDFEAGPYCVDFAEGQTKACTNIPIINDDIHEREQDFGVSIDVPDGVPLVPGDNITITIEDDDSLQCMIEEGSLVVLESDGTVTVGISINREIEEPVDCLISTTPVTALDNDDFEPFLEKRVTFEPQKGRSQMVSLKIIDDENPEPTENLRIEAKSGDLQIAGGNGTDPTTFPAINITIIDDDDRCQLTQNSIISTFFEEAMFVFNKSCPFEMVATCPQGGQEAIPFQIQIDLVNGNTDSARVAIEFDKSTVVIHDDGRVTMPGNGERIIVTQSSERVIVQVEALDVTVTRTLGEGGQVTVSISNTSDLVQANQLCGLCGNEKGMLIFKDGSPVPSEDPVEVSKFLEELSVSRSEQLFGDLRSECGEAPQIRNDTVIGDPLYEVPLRLSKELTDQYGELSLCYEIHGRANSVFNLISDICVSVNAHYSPMIIPSNGNIINQIGVVAEDSTGQCQRIQVNLTECAASVNGVSVTSYNQNGISVIRRSGFKFPRVRISVPNCDNLDLVMWVVCEERHSQPMIKFVVARGHNLTPTSHGLIAQFWNVDVSAEKYTVTEDDKISPSNEHFAITVRPPSGGVRKFFADIHPQTWDLKNQHCLYAGSGQGGRTYEVPSLPDTVIQGRYVDYKTDGLFAYGYQYSRFESTCGSNSGA